MGVGSDASFRWGRQASPHPSQVSVALHTNKMNVRLQIGVKAAESLLQKSNGTEYVI